MPHQTHRTVIAREPSRFPATVSPTFLGLIGSLCILVGSFGAGWIGDGLGLREWFPIAFFRSSPDLTRLCTMLLIVGGFLLVIAWLRFRPSIRDDDASLRRVIRTSVIWALPLLICVPVFSRDMFSYVAVGRLMAAGIDPYQHGVNEIAGWYSLGVDPFWSSTESPYGPLFIAVAAVFSWLGAEIPEYALFLNRLAATAGAVLMVVAFLKIAALRGRNRAFVAWMIAANPLTLLLFIASGHNDGLMLAGMGFGLLAALKGRRILAVVLIALAIAIKPIALIALPIVALVGRPSTLPLWDRVKSWALHGAIAIGLVGALGLVLGLGFGWVTALTVPGAIQHWYSPLTLMVGTVRGLAELVSLDPFVFEIILKVIAFSLAGLVASWVVITKRPIDPVLRLVLCTAVIVAASTAIHPWYVMWILPFAAVAGPWRKGQEDLAVLATVFFTTVTLAEPTDSFFEGPYTRLVVALITVLFALSVLVWWWRSRNVSGRAVLVAVPYGQVLVDRLAARRERKQRLRADTSR